MAEFALGLTKTAVEGTLSRVKSAIEEEGMQRVRVQEDLVFITGEFQMMQAFLNASSTGERASKNLVARAWLRQLRDLAFDVENCVEFVIHLKKPSPWDWVQRLASSLPCLARPPLPLDEVVAEIKRLKVRVEDVSQRNTCYNLMAGGGDNDDENQHQQLLMHPAKGHASARAETFLALRDVWKALGKLPDTTGDLKMLIDCQGSELKVISLWGTPHADVAGELGWASSLVKDAYVDPEICQQFKNRACVKLTNPFNPAEFLNNLLTHFTSHHHDRHDDMSKLVLQLSQHKYLIILEQELSSVADWEAARICTGEPFQVWELQRFSHDRYLCAIFPKDVIGRCREFLAQHDCLIFVELLFPADWDLIRQHLLCDSTRACIVVITRNPSVAKHCVGHQQHLALNVRDLLNKGSHQEPQSGHADGGGNIVKEEGESEPDELVGREYEQSFFRSHSGVTMLSVWGFSGIGKSAVVREYYNYCKLNTQDYRMYGWVDVPSPFSLTVLCQRLLMDLHQDDHDTKEKVAIGMVEGQDPIMRCCKILREKQCLLVIDDLRSNQECDLIKATLLAQANIGGRTIVITREESIARLFTNTEKYEGPCSNGFKEELQKQLDKHEGKPALRLL